MTDDLKMLPMIQPRRVITRSFNNTEYKIRIARPITEIDDFEEEIMALEEANDNDFVYMQISSPGGSLETCEFLCNRMKECRAPIVVEIGLCVASAASAMTLQADDWVIHDSSTMMVHACSYSPGYGKEVDVRTSVAYTERVNKEWVERTYRGFLSDQQLSMVLDGKDLYFYADDLREMLARYKEYRKENEEQCNCGNCSVDNEENGDYIDDEEQGQSLDLKDMIKEVVREVLLEQQKAEVKEQQKPVKASKPKKGLDAAEMYKELSQEAPLEQKIDIQT
jgi:ATP-dependent protease ClpP protease subunit